MEPISLYQLQKQIKRVLALNFDGPLFIKAEVARMRNSRGHIFLELAEKAEDTTDVIAKGTAVIWRSNFQQLKKRYGKILEEILEEGTQIAFHAELQFHEVYGMKLMIHDIDPDFTLGAIAKNRAQIIQQLEQEQWVEKNRQQPIPSVIQNIAVISSKQAAGYEDFKTTLEDPMVPYAFSIRLFPAAMQGNRVEQEVVQQLAAIEARQEQFDVIVIVRGGGGRIDLSYFDSYEIGKYIANASLPVWTGIGHQRDMSVADIVANFSFRTPTAIAEAVIKRNDQFQERLEQIFIRLQQLLKERVQSESNRFQRYQEQIRFLLRQQIERNRVKLNYLSEGVQSSFQNQLQRNLNQLGFLKQRLEDLAPEKVLQRGYAAVEQNGQRLLTARQIDKAESLTVYFKEDVAEINIAELKSYEREI